ncbi:hypothetical protein TIFTF001_015159 [Ficus carica]|uniref:Uncharacterized protein n=1 Tax=Ficus carica TaxID=3494 RepID=A0AA88DIL0_FICCA|nr:hypothetical protein TIFTF001_015159 [Ficus carica]
METSQRMPPLLVLCVSLREYQRADDDMHRLTVLEAPTKCNIARRGCGGGFGEQESALGSTSAGFDKCSSLTQQRGNCKAPRLLPLLEEGVTMWYPSSCSIGKCYKSSRVRIHLEEKIINFVVMTTRM